MINGIIHLMFVFAGLTLCCCVIYAVEAVQNKLEEKKEDQRR